MIYCDISQKSDAHRPTCNLQRMLLPIRCCACRWTKQSWDTQTLYTKYELLINNYWLNLTNCRDWKNYFNVRSARFWSATLTDKIGDASLWCVLCAQLGHKFLVPESGTISTFERWTWVERVSLVSDEVKEKRFLTHTVIDITSAVVTNRPTDHRQWMEADSGVCRGGRL